MSSQQEKHKPLISQQITLAWAVNYLALSVNWLELQMSLAGTIKRVVAAGHPRGRVGERGGMVYLHMCWYGCPCSQLACEIVDPMAAAISR